MKTGELAKALGVDQGTIKNWVSELSEFFSDAAQNKGRAQRDYSDEDVITLNTIRTLRLVEGTTSWDKIREFLDSGRRYELPAEVVLHDSRARPTPISSSAPSRFPQSCALPTRRLRACAASSPRRRNGMSVTERTAKSCAGRISRRFRELMRQIGKLEARLEMLKD